jgi:2-dehydro-3-deoxygalactonokinase
MPREFLSCDWGTSSFRIRWVVGREVLLSYQDDTGCRVMFDRAAKSPSESRATVYESFLRKILSSLAKTWWGEVPAEPLATGNRIDRLGRSLAPPDQLELVISGMASSSIGWEELAYARTPLALDASNLSFKRLAWNKPEWISETYLISGAATEEEIMRGEETEAIGLLNQVSTPDGCLLILPGTHSKHILIRDRRIETFTTYMTGELFDVLAHHSILKATIDLASFANLQRSDWKAFETGVDRATKSGLCGSLFQTRTRAILKQCPPGENAWFLSGQLIGAELAEAATKIAGIPILLGGVTRLRSLYARALGLVGVKNFHEFDDATVAAALPTAHALFLESIWKR